jgi:multicomponent Na+:H+ antiporter subunit D
MSAAAAALLIAIAAPLAQGVLVLAFPRPPGLRDSLHIFFALVSAGAALVVLNAAAHGQGVRIALARPLPHVDLAFMIEPVGALTGALVALLGALHAVHAAGFLRVQTEREPGALLAFSAFASTMAMGAAYAANLMTYFIAFLLLSLAAFPLALRAAGEGGRRAARGHLAVMLTASFAMLLPAMVWLYAIAGTLEFRPGGLLAGRVDAWSANTLLVLLVLGVASAAPAPMRDRLAATNAPNAQGLALTHCVAVAPIVGAGLIKITTYVFGAAMAEAALATRGLLVALGVGACAAAVIALSKQELHERTSYSLLAQTLLVITGALLASPVGVFGAALQMLAASCAAATMLMAVGAVIIATGRRSAAEFVGLGKLMPWIIASFALAAATLIGMPPFSGAWAKLSLISAAAHQGGGAAAVLAGAAAILTFAHLGPLAANALAGAAPDGAFKRPDGAPLLLVVPVALGAAATFSLVFLANPLFDFLSVLWRTPQ